MAQLKEDESHVVTFVVRGAKKTAEVKKYMKALRRALGRKAKITQKKQKTRAKRRKSKRRKPR